MLFPEYLHAVISELPLPGGTLCSTAIVNNNDMRFSKQTRERQS